jgi:hypothetical protein
VSKPLELGFLAQTSTDKKNQQNAHGGGKPDGQRSATHFYSYGQLKKFLRNCRIGRRSFD